MQDISYFASSICAGVRAAMLGTPSQLETLLRNKWRRIRGGFEEKETPRLESLARICTKSSPGGDVKVFSEMTNNNGGANVT
jgi:hypothetical protein